MLKNCCYLMYWNLAFVMHCISSCPAEHWTIFSCCLKFRLYVHVGLCTVCVNPAIAAKSNKPLLLLLLLLRPVRRAEYCNQFVCLSVCLCACLSVREHISGTAGPIFTNFLCRFPVAVAWSSSGGVAIRYVLPVLWMTSRLAVMGHMAMRGRLNL